MFLDRPAQCEIARASRGKSGQFGAQTANDFLNRRVNIFDIDQPLFFGRYTKINFARSRILQSRRRCRLRRPPRFVLQKPYVALHGRDD